MDGSPSRWSVHHSDLGGRRVITYMANMIARQTRPARYQRLQVAVRLAHPTELATHQAVLGSVSSNLPFGDLAASARLEDVIGLVAWNEFA